jgi:hypothetical protein
VLDRVSEVDSVRVLGVQKDRPYATPGTEVEFRMLWHDGAPGEPRPVQRLWVGGCINPEGDSYQGCVPLFRDGQAVPETRGPFPLEGAAPPTRSSTREDVVRFTMPPADVALRRVDDSAAYGVYIAFFAVCAGQLTLATTNGAFPVACKSADGETLGPDEFVAGYTSVYLYDEAENRTNGNPVISGFNLFLSELQILPISVEGERAPGCIGADCFERSEVPSDCAENTCIPACPDDGDDERCFPWGVWPVILQAQNDESDERMWISYHADRGSLASDVRLVRDEAYGFIEDYATFFYAPKEPGLTHLWAVVRDSRGGAEWVHVPILITQ